MPIYEYKCSKCSHKFEAMQKFSDAPLSVCPVCKGPLKKLVSQTSFQLKGTGWYMTDYAKKNTPHTEPSAPSSTESKSETKSETKPAVSTPTTTTSSSGSSD